MDVSAPLPGVTAKKGCLAPLVFSTLIVRTLNTSGFCNLSVISVLTLNPVCFIAY